MTPRQSRQMQLRQRLLSVQQRSCGRAGWRVRQQLCMCPRGRGDTGQPACRPQQAGQVAVAAVADAAALCQQQQGLVVLVVVLLLPRKAGLVVWSTLC